MYERKKWKRFSRLLACDANQPTDVIRSLVRRFIFPEDCRRFAHQWRQPMAIDGDFLWVSPWRSQWRCDANSATGLYNSRHLLNNNSVFYLEKKKKTNRTDVVTDVLARRNVYTKYAIGLKINPNLNLNRKTLFIFIDGDSFEAANQSKFTQSSKE